MAETLARTGGSVHQAADILQVGRATLYEQDQAIRPLTWHARKQQRPAPTGRFLFALSQESDAHPPPDIHGRPSESAASERRSAVPETCRRFPR
ncbi:helix-turn-helix domain-containing protein [Cupriavidus basilensis]